MFASNKKLTIFIFLVVLNAVAFGQTPSAKEKPPMLPYRDAPTPYWKFKRSKEIEFWLLNEQSDRLRAPTEYYTKFSNKKYNLARLYPDLNCYGGDVISVNKIDKCTEALSLIGDGSYYSFRLKTNVNQRWERILGKMIKAQWADIKFGNGKLTVGSEIVQGMITNLGDKDFEAISSDSPEIRSLKDFAAEKVLSKFEKQKTHIADGIQINGQKYTTSIPVKLETLYVLRSIAFQLRTPTIRWEYPDKNQQTKELDFYDPFDWRLDIIVAFKIVEIEKDGSLIILWKELRRKPAPFLEP